MRPLRRAPWLCSLIAGTALAANPYLERGRALYQSLQFSDAIHQLTVARDVPDNDPQEKIEILDLLARCEVADGRRPAAERHYQELLAEHPSFELERSLSPKILEAFDAAKQRLFAPGYVALRPLPSPPDAARAELVDPWHLASDVVWHWRAAGEEQWHQAAAAVEDHVVAFPLGAQHQEWLAWYAQARGEEGKVVAEWGSEAKPQVYATLPPSAIWSPGPRVEPSRHDRGLAIALAVGAVLAVAAGAVLEAQSQHDQALVAGESWADQANADHSRALTEARIGIGAFAGGGALALAGGVLFVW